MTIGTHVVGHHDGFAASDSEETINLRRLLSTLWRRKMIVLGTTAVFTSIALLVVMQVTPLYVAEAELVVEPPRSNVLDIENVAQSLATDYYTNETQAAIIGSRVLAEKIVDRFDLINDPQFNPDLRPPKKGLLERLRQRGLLPESWQIPEGWRFTDLIPESWRTALRDFGATADEEEEAPSEEPLSPEAELLYLHEQATDIYVAGLSVAPSDSSRVITVSFTSEDPETAARMANAAIEVYIDDQINSKSELTAQANAWLQERTLQLKKQVSKAAAAVENHRRKTGLVDVDGASLLSKQIAELNSRLIVVRAERAEAEARFNQIERLLASESGLDSAAAVLQSSLIQRLREQEAQVVRKIAEMKTQYRDGHPKMILARSELTDLVDKIKSEVRKIATNLGNELEIAQVRERNLAFEIGKLEKQLRSQANAEITLRALEAELEANQKLYDTILARLKETGVQDTSIQQADARVISYATTPFAPSYPRKKLIVGIAFIGSAILGVLIILLLEHLDSGFRSRDQIEAASGLVALGMVPRMRTRGFGNVMPHDDVIDRPHTILAESFRSLRTALLLSNVDAPPRTIVVTSSVPGEGKSTAALALTRTAAKHGQKCIIIDADLRKPSLHRYFGVSNDLGLIDYLSCDIALEEMVQVDFRSGAHYILAGRSIPHPADLLGSSKMRSLIQALRATYEFVIVDTGPVLAMSDALVLLRCVDKTVFLVRWEKTRRETALAGIRQVVDTGADIAGLVLSQVDLRKNAQFHYGDARYFSYYGYGGDSRSQASG